MKHEEREMARGREEERERKAKRKREGGIIDRQRGEKGIVDTVLQEMFKNKAWRPGQSLYVHLIGPQVSGYEIIRTRCLWCDTA